MKYPILSIAVIIACCLAGCAGSKPYSSPFNGTWEYYVEDQTGGRYAGTLSVRAEEGSITGTITNEALALRVPLKNIVTMDNQLMFEFDGGSYGDIDVTVVAEEESITGEFIVESLGELPLFGSRLTQRISDTVAAAIEGSLASTISGNPDSARIYTTDIPNFWMAFDAAQPSFDPGPFNELYINNGSPGVQGFVPNRIQNGTNLANVVKKHEAYYTSIRPKTLELPNMEPAIRNSFHRFKELYPEAVFPDVYIVIGALNSGGTASDRALIIGAEMFGRSANTVTTELSDWQKANLKTIEDIHYTVAHELIHFQQRYASKTLLEQSLKEGSADFLGRMISGKSANEQIPAYAEAREEALWNEFKKIMHGEDFAGWLYGGSGIEGRPADLGYWMGDRIVQAYYDQAEDKEKAIKDIINIEDATKFLEASGYSNRFN